MKIYSKFKDYYDIALVHGSQADLLFERKIENVDIRKNSRMNEKFTPLQLTGIKIAQEIKNLSTTYEVEKKFKFHPMMVIFCGKSYPGFHVTHESVGMSVVPVKTVDGCFYDMESLSSYLRKNGSNIADLKEEKRSRWNTLYFGQRTSKKIEDFFSISGSNKFENDLLEHKIVTAVVTSYQNSEGEYFTINLPLREVNFYRKFDPWQAHQELSMYIGGVLAPDSKPIIKVADKCKIIGHGFDEMSFRKPPIKVH
ncbi:MAG: hypothetical protein H7263_15365 [Candidatus Sericytochromatia bacterium]|nr:hypothetical protein [Candidatus Sericytochromatia bacterium]